MYILYNIFIYILYIKTSARSQTPSVFLRTLKVLGRPRMFWDPTKTKPDGDWRLLAAPIDSQAASPVLCSCRILSGGSNQNQM